MSSSYIQPHRGWVCCGELCGVRGSLAFYPHRDIGHTDIAVGGLAAWTVTLTLIHDGMVNGGTVANDTKKKS